MARKQRSVEQIIRLLREVEVELAKGLDVAFACKKAGITKQTYYRWRKTYGGLEINQAKRLKELETENRRLKSIVGEKEIDIQILKEALRGK
jgi:transposase-like protein